MPGAWLVYRIIGPMFYVDSQTKNRLGTQIDPPASMIDSIAIIALIRSIARIAKC
jgi:hypothetical protein